MPVDSSVLEMIIFIEIFLVILIIVMTFILKLALLLKSSYNHKVEQEITNHLTFLLENGVNFNSQGFLWRWRRLNALMLVLSKADQSFNGQSWIALKNDLTSQIVLPLARKKFTSRLRNRRLLAAKCFSLFVEEQDETIIYNLLNNKIPTIHLYAAIAAIKLSSPLLINEVINNIARHRRLGQTIYLKLFAEALPQIVPVVIERLKREEDPYILASCYKILTLFPPSDQTINISQHLQLDNIELKLAIIRYEAHTKSERSVQLLITLLSSSFWQVRAICCKLLGELVVTKSIKELSNCLHDPVWWVRINAANALKGMGDPGLKILAEQNSTDDLFAYDTAVYVLNTLSLAK